MKSHLVTAVITTFVLALFLKSGNALVCYDCESAICKETTTCRHDQDACIVAHYGAGNTSSCWKYSDCTQQYFSDVLLLSNYKFRCCTWNLCNDSPNVVASKTVLSGAFLLTVVHMLTFLVWN